MSNYPAGSTNDPNAPWNEEDVKFCPYCQQDELDQYVRDNFKEDEEYESFDKTSLYRICRECHAHDMADMYRDEY